MTAYLREQKMAVQYMPERLEVVADLPRTPSGKIQKFELRKMAAAQPAASASAPIAGQAIAAPVAAASAADSRERRL